MSPDAVRELRESFALVRPMADAAAAAFYGRLFAADPSLRPMFPADMAPQRAVLMATLGTAIGAAGRLETMRPLLREMGARHAGYGVRDEHYGAVGTALLETLSAALGARFTPSARAAWAELYRQVAGAMQEGARAPA